MKSLFYVEDNAEFLKLVPKALPGDYTCHAFANPEVALDLIFSGSHPDVIITDLKMPGKSGIEFIEQLRTFGYRNPIIIATGHIEREEIITALRLGICDILDKPFTVDALLGAIQRAEIEIQMRGMIKDMNAKLLSAVDCLEEVVSGFERRVPHDANSTKLMDLARLLKEDFELLKEREKRLRYRSPLDTLWGQDQSKVLNPAE
jgi:CheY-like chemotaxis protein